MDIEKKKRSLNKKLKQILDLKSKVENGEIIPDADQVEKLKKESLLRNQLAELV